MISFNKLPLHATSNTWKLGNNSKDLAIEFDSKNSSSICGSDKNQFRINYTNLDLLVKNSKWNNTKQLCKLNLILPKNLTSKTTASNFSKFVKSAYFEILVKGNWVKESDTKIFGGGECSEFYCSYWSDLNYMSIPIFAFSTNQEYPTLKRSELRNPLCSNRYGPLPYILESSYRFRVVVLTNGTSPQKLYSKQFEVNYGNHPDNWIQNCQANESFSSESSERANSNKTVCSGVEVYKWNILQYQVLYELRYKSKGYQSVIAALKTQAGLIQDSCSVDLFDSVKYKNNSIECNTQEKNLLVEIVPKVNLLGDQLIENAVSQKSLISKINFAESTGKTSEATKFRLQYEKLISDAQWINPMQKALISAFRALDSSCARSGVVEPRI